MLGVGGSVIGYFIIWPNRMELFYLLYGAMTPPQLQESRVQCMVEGGAMCKVYLVTICIDIVS